MSDRIRYPAASYPGAILSSDRGRDGASRQEQLIDLQNNVPDCTPVDPQRRKWQLPVLLPQHSVTSDGVSTVTMELDVPLDYPGSKAELRVNPIIQHLWVNQSTGVLNHGETGFRSLLQIMLDGYEALSGTQYVPQASSLAHLSSGRAESSFTGGKVQLKNRIQAKLQSLDTEELCKIITDSQTFQNELQTWLRETNAGREHAEAHKALLRAARASKDLLTEYEGTEQQVRVTQSGEVQPSLHKHDELLEKQATLLSRIDVDALIQSVVAEAKRMDNGDAEKAEILSRGVTEPWEQHVLNAKVDAYMQKRQTLHEADIKAKAASQLLTRR